jgi:hypothetical protein
MNPLKLKKFIIRAQEIIQHSHDPIHDFSHTQQVVANIEKIVIDKQLSASEQQTLTLAGWWHDTGRTITKQTSIIWLTLFDDFISAIMLSWEALKLGELGKEVRCAVRIIICKSVGTGIILKILLFPKSRQLMYILRDADNLDVITPERMEKIINIMKKTKIHNLGYKMVSWYVLQKNGLRFKNQLAKQEFKKVLKRLAAWLEKPEIANWYITKFGEKWCRKMAKQLEKLADEKIKVDYHIDQ